MRRWAKTRINIKPGNDLYEWMVIRRKYETAINRYDLVSAKAWEKLLILAELQLIKKWREEDPSAKVISTVMGWDTRKKAKRRKIERNTEVLKSVLDVKNLINSKIREHPKKKIFYLPHPKYISLLYVFRRKNWPISRKGQLSYRGRIFKVDGFPGKKRN